MAGLRSLTKEANQPGLNSNFDVDYVIHYRVPPTEKAEAEASFTQLISALSTAGFATEVRPGDATSLLLFLKIASERLLRTQIYRSRLQDWLYGVRTSPPSKDLNAYFASEPVSEAERLRLAYLLISRPKNEGGAGITAGRKEGQWRFVESVFPLHDHKFNREWIAKWSKKYTLDEGDIEGVRDKFGEQVAFYFAFLQCYFTFLAAPAAVGFGAWLLLGQFSWLYAVANCLWSVVFFEYWRKREVDLAVQWGTRGVSALQRPRAQFRFEREAVDPVTGEIVKVWSPLKRLQRQMLQVPFAVGCVVVLGSLIVTCFGIEIFISEIYNGPFKQYLVFLPTILLTIFMPVLTTLLTGFAGQLTDLENYETHDDHQASLVQKIFVINFITSYTPIILTAFVYVPFGHILVPYLDIFSVTAQHLTSTTLKTKPFRINPDRLTKQVIYFTVTAQVVNFVLETIVPYAKRKIFSAVEHAQEEVTSTLSKNSTTNEKSHYPDRPDEAPFLARVREEAALPAYDVTVDYREMVVQFGYLALFSCVWPLAAVSFLANNWVEARGDALKIAISSQRPIPWRADGIGPWLGALGFLSWVGSVTSAAIIYQFSGTGREMPTYESITAWKLLLAVFVAEHGYLAVRVVVRYAIGKVTQSPGLQKEKRERFEMRKNMLAETLEDESGAGEMDVNDVADAAAGGLRVRGAEEITREALEEEARRASVRGSGKPEELFWQRQRGAGETIQIGRSLIAELHSSNNTTARK